MPRVPYFRSYLLLSRRRWVLAMLAAIAGAVLLATLVPFATDSAYNYSVDRYYETYSFLLHQGGTISDAEHRQVRRLESIIEEADPAEYCRKVRSYELWEIKEQKFQGRSSDPDARRLYSFTTTFLNAVCKLNSPALYQGTDDMPGLVLVAYYLGALPSPVLLLAPFALLWVIARENASSRLLSHAPLSPQACGCTWDASAHCSRSFSRSCPCFPPLCWASSGTAWVTSPTPSSIGRTTCS